MPLTASRPGLPLGAVLAGGLSRRMGRPKALELLGGRPLVAHALAAIEGAGLTAVVVAKQDSPLPDLGCEVVRETGVARHPAAGILAALEAARGGAVVVLACDMPLVPSVLLRHLAGLDAPMAAVEIGGRVEPLIARYDPRIEAALREAVRQGAPLRHVLARAGVHVVAERELARFGDPARIALNVNDPAGLERARRLVG